DGRCLSALARTGAGAGDRADDRSQRTEHGATPSAGGEGRALETAIRRNRAAGAHRSMHDGPGIVRVVVADDSEISAAYLERMLEEDPKIRVIGRARNGAEALAL